MNTTELIATIKPDLVMLCDSEEMTAERHAALSRIVGHLTPPNLLALIEALESAQQENTDGVAGMAESYETTISMLRSRIAELESRADAEPYGYVHKAAYEQCGSSGLSNDHEGLAGSPDHIPLYTLPQPAPVVVPDERSAFEVFMAKRFGDIVDRRRVKNGDQEYMAWDMTVAWVVWSGRAAMLQGKAEPVSQPYTLPEGYALVPVEPTQEMIMAADPHCPEAFEKMHKAYKAMLAAAPQQEAGNA